MSTELPAQQDKHRLPTNVKPSHYDLIVWTNLKSLEFGGLVSIDLDVLEETSVIIINCSDDLDVGNVFIHCAGLHAKQLQSVEIAEKGLGRLTLNFLVALPAGSKAQLKIPFNAKLRGTMTGYYKSGWQKDGQSEYYALTYFQPIDARAAFPCFDEPLFKATFSIRMVSQVDTVNISNMPATFEGGCDPNSFIDPDLASVLSNISKDVEWKITEFQKTPPMSTYIVAFANGPFSYLEKTVEMPLSGRTIPLRVYATPDIIHQAAFCLELTSRVLPLYETIFDIEYPLPKLDTLAVNDFDIGAMENWGLIIGRASAFLVDPDKLDINIVQEIARTQSHEVAHMWFGNITTMEWWNYLYLNEGVYFLTVVKISLAVPKGFATLMGEFIVLEFNLRSGKIFPEWEIHSQFLTGHVNTALQLDAKRSSHPVEVECPDANFLNQVRIHVLRMLSDYVGEEKFLKGVSMYLKAHLYGNTVTSDLWDGISAVTGQDISHLMETWITKIGFPLITVTESASEIHVRQDRFLDSGAPEARENETLWSIPLRLLSVTEDGQVQVDKTTVLEEREKTFVIDTSKSFKLNAGSIGFYRVLYTPERLSKIAIEAAKDNSVFSLSDRIGLIYDVAELSKAGLVRLSSFFTVVDIWRAETNCNISHNIGTVTGVFWEYPHIVEGLRAFRRTLFAPLVQRLGYEFPEGESIDIVQLRKTAIQAASNARDESVIQELRNRFAVYMKTGEGISPNLQRIIFITAARWGGRDEFNALFKIIEDPTKPNAKTEALFAIGFIPDLGLVDEIFSYILTKARDQDVMTLFWGLGNNAVAHRPLAKFFKDNYDVFSERFATNSVLKLLVEASFCNLSTQKDYDDLESFFKDKDTSRYSMALAQTLETIQSRIAYIGVRASIDNEDHINP
ncbi:peptidase family M1-domain-containing protein [Mycena capillaripes]|nr:peptidase family M1-domain-containing protein [Mycena capillaripes]